MAVDSKAFQHPLLDSGSFTSAATAVDVTETLGYSPSFVIVLIDMHATNPDVIIASAASTTQSLSLLGSTGVVTSPLVAVGLDITATGFIVRAEEQNDDGVNGWWASR